MVDRSDDPCLVWFRDDLRLSDHPALHAAAASSRPTICLYILDETSPHPGARPLGGAARWWLAQSLRALQKSLAGLGVPLVLRKGAAAKIIPRVARESGASDVFWNTVGHKPERAIEGDVAAALHELGIGTQVFAGDLLAGPQSVRGKEGRGLRV